MSNLDRAVLYVDLLKAPKLDADPDTTGWGTTQKGWAWFNKTEGRYKYWTGAAKLTFPSASSGGAPVDASYVTINAEAGLDAEIQHANITDQAQIHVPKYHTAIHEDEASDEIRKIGGLVRVIKNSGADLLAVVAAYGGERPIFLPNGSYSLSSMLDVNVPNTVIIGASRMGTTISLANGVNDHVLRLSASNCRLSNFRIDGNRANQTGTSHGIYVYESAGHRIVNLKIRDCLNDGIHVGKSTWDNYTLGGKIYHCYVGDNSQPNYGSGIFLDYSATDWHVLNCVLARQTQAGKAGLDLMGSSNKIVMTHFWGNYYNIRIGGNTGTGRAISRIRIVANGIMDNMHHGIYKTSEAHTLRGGTITGNTFWRNGESDVGNKDSIHFASGGGTVRSLAIGSNQFLGAVEDLTSPVRKTRYAISDNGLMSYSSFIGNTINNYLNATPINIAGLNNEVDHNPEYNCG